MQKKIIAASIAILIVLSGWFVLGRAANLDLISAANARKKSKWQLKLERRNIPLVFWQKYLPKVSSGEYKKAIKKFTKYLKVNPDSYTGSSYILHQNIVTTTFWVGEPAGSENGFISNTTSAWDDLWRDHFGGFDDPNNRNGYFPAAFTPQENPFYFALPYNDFDENGNRKGAAGQVIPWASEKTWSSNESMCKNRWIRIIKGNLVAYAQWEDVGPFESDDTNYVFGLSAPHNPENNLSGLDVSPAVRDYLGLSGLDSASWQFVSAGDVPAGPWKQIITSSNITW